MGPGGMRWLLIRGRGDRPLEAKVDRAAICAHGSSRRPAVEPGDLCILYAAVWQAIFGITEVTGEPEHEPAARGGRRPRPGAGGGGGRDLPAEHLAALAHPSVGGAIRAGAPPDPVAAEIDGRETRHLLAVATVPGSDPESVSVQGRC